MVGACLEYGVSVGTFCSDYVTADQMVFVSLTYEDAHSYEASLTILVAGWVRVRVKGAVLDLQFGS